MKHFCTAGPVQADIHYVLPPLERVNREEILGLVEARKYFTLHAPRQTGKTSVLLALVDDLNASGRYRALYINVEAAQAAREDYVEANRIIVSLLTREARRVYPNDSFAEAEPSQSAPGDLLGHMLAQWTSRSALPTCLLIDEIDALIGDSLLSVLRQLRAGYVNRPLAFPQCVVLCGVRDIRDYRIHGTKEVITGGSAFNIKAESIRLRDFSTGEIRALYQQHTAETGQVFDEAVYPLVWELTQGQPWLVNALAFEACFKLQKDRAKPISTDVINEAREKLILDRVTHLDQLADKLKEPRVRRVIQPILNGDERFDSSFSEDDDLQYVVDLGLVRRGRNGLEIANAIYREVIPRQLTYITQIEMESRERTAWYVAPSGKLDIAKLIASFQQFFRENSEIWLERYQYREAGPQLLLQAFLQRIVNGGGRIEREYALGRKRTDLLIVWNHPGGVQRAVIEIKLLRGSIEKTIAEGSEQTAEYVDRSGAEEGHLIIFNRDDRASWDEKVFRREAATAAGPSITIWGM
ncbi:MAG: hypothetical protein JNL98_33335 [Bryobacterales bacterium]|nr:hypothetical protein [Bryobacterales bacterium]